MSSFEFTDEFGQRLRIAPVEREQPDEAPALWFETTDGGFRGTAVKVPLGKLEEAIAGQRDMARQAGGQPAPSAVVCLSTPCDACEHTLNWHDNKAGCSVPRCVCGRFQMAVEEQPC